MNNNQDKILFWGCFIALLAAIAIARLNVPSPFLYGGF